MTTDRMDRPREESGGERVGGAWRFAAPVVLLLILAATLFLYGEITGYVLLGHDTYPIIAAARIQDASDLAGTFTEELMDGRYVRGHFYRPLLNLSFALDHALWGLEPRGYHTTDLLLLALVAVLLFRLVLRFDPGRSISSRFAAAGLVAALFLVSHPSLLNVLPISARRADTLAMLFLLLALLLSTSRRPAVAVAGPVLCTLAAVGSKETGALAVPLLFLFHLLRPLSTGRGRLRGALGAGFPSLAVLLVFLGIRHAVIGGLGGHAEIGAGSVLGRVFVSTPGFLRNMIWPAPFLGDLLGGAATGLVAPILVAAGSVLLLLRSNERRVVLFCVAWILLGLVIHGFSGDIQPWYVFHIVVPFAILFGFLLTAAIGSALRAPSIIVRGALVVGALLLLFLLCVNVRFGLPFERYPQWRELSVQVERYIEALEKAIEATPDGATIDGGRIPYGHAGGPRSLIRHAAGLNDYSVDAWAELVFPERTIRIAPTILDPPPPGPDEVLVVVRRR